jgi:hypothetical protein
MVTEYYLNILMKEELENGSNDLVTRRSGQIIRDRIERDILKEEIGTIIALNFSKIGVIDYSCSDEIVAKLISRLLGGEYGERYIALIGLNENQKENIEVALERKGLAVTALMNNGGRVILGHLNNYLKETLQLIFCRNLITLKSLSEAMNLEANTSGTRLLNLHKKYLVKRREESGESGRVWVYESIV